MEKRKKIQEMTLDELMLAERIFRTTKESFVRVQNFQSAIIWRDKEVKIANELSRRIEENFDI